MIAKNYMKHPEALRFQRELFSNGYHNQPRIMRLMECIFDWTPSVPGWWTAAKAKARALAKAVKKSIADFFQPLKGNHEHKETICTTTCCNASDVGWSIAIRGIIDRRKETSRPHDGHFK